GRLGAIIAAATYRPMMMATAIICRDPRLRLRRASQSGRAQDGFIDAATGTTCGQLALDDHRGNRMDAEPVGALGPLDVLHVVNDHLTRGASRAPDELDRLMAGRASGAEHFDLSGSGHRPGPIYLGAVPSERSPMATRWQTLPLGGTSQVKGGVPEPPTLERRDPKLGYDRNHIQTPVPSAQSRLQPQEAIMIRMALFALLAIVATTATAIAQTVSPYAGQEQRAIKALSDEEIRDLLEARGMGLAKAAELNSYPGPLHVLQLANELGLSDAQR